MSVTLKVGKRLFSAVCSTEMVIVKAPTGEVDVTIGGASPVMSAEERPDAGSPLGGFTGGTLIGKRYINPAGDIELLCTKAGDGIPAFNGTPMDLKEAKPLPASD